MKASLLPVGTIVELQDSEVKVMISGYCPQGSAKPGYVWDYSGFIFPIGYRSAQEVVLFDNAQIKKIVAMGYQDEEQFNFIGKVEEAIDTLKAGNEQA